MNEINSFNCHLFELVSDLISTPLDGLNPAIYEVLEEIGKKVDVDRVCIFDYNYDNGVMQHSYEWCKAGVKGFKNKHQKVLLDLIPEWINIHEKGERIHIPNVSVYKSSKIRRMLEVEGIKSLLALPIIKNKECIGFIGFNSIDKLHNYTDEEEYMLRILANMMASVRIRFENEKNLQEYQRKLQEVESMAKVGDWELNLESNEFSWSDEVFNIFELDSSTFKPSLETLVDKIHPDDLYIIADLYGDINKSRYDLTHRILVGDERVKHVEERAEVNYDATGMPISITGIIRDITQSKENARQIEEQLNDLSLINELSTSILQGLNLEQILGIIGYKIRKTFNCVSAVAAIVNSEKTNLEVKKIELNSSHLLKIEKLLGRTLPSLSLQIPIQGEGYFAQAYKSGEPLSITGKKPFRALLAEFTRNKSLRALIPAVMRLLNFESVLIMPIRLKKEVLGVIEVSRKVPFEKQEIRRVKRLMDLLAIVLEQKHIEKQLRLSESNLKRAATLGNQGYFNLDVDSGKIVLSESIKEIFRIDENSELPKTINDFFDDIHPDDVRFVRKQYRLAVKRKKGFDIHYRILSKNGDEKYVRSIGEMKQGNDARWYFFGAIADITSIRLKEREILKFSKVVESSLTAIALGDMDGNIIYVNDACVKLWGYEKKEMIGEPYADFWDLSKEERKRFRDTLLKGKGWRGELRAIRKDGTVMDLDLSANIVYDKDGTALCVQGSFQDVSEQKRYEKRLKEAFLKSQETNRLKSAFLASISHELRTPLNAILGFSSIITDTAEDKEINELATIINETGNRLSTIIDDILDLALAEQSEVKVRNEELLLGDFFADMAKEAKAILIKSNKNELIKLKEKLARNVADLKVITDRNKVIQVLTNLIRNAVKFTERGEIELELFSNDDFISFKVRDTGIGISQEEQKTIFEFFRQVDDSYSRKYEGVGVGLAISNKIAIAMGAKILIDSVENEGASFTFKFPKQVVVDA